MAITGTIGFIVNVIWACTFGWVLFLAYLLAGILCCITLVGILQAFKLAGISFWPVGRRVVPIEVANLARSKNARAKLAEYRGATA